LRIGGTIKKPTIVKTAKKMISIIAIFFKTDFFIIFEKSMGFPPSSYSFTPLGSPAAHSGDDGCSLFSEHGV
jgi:hypothetical protein